MLVHVTVNALLNDGLLNVNVIKTKVPSTYTCVESFWQRECCLKNSAVLLWRCITIFVRMVTVLRSALPWLLYYKGTSSVGLASGLSPTFSLLMMDFRDLVMKYGFSAEPSLRSKSSTK